MRKKETARLIELLDWRDEEFFIKGSCKYIGFLDKEHIKQNVKDLKELGEITTEEEVEESWREGFYAVSKGHYYLKDDFWISRGFPRYLGGDVCYLVEAESVIVSIGQCAGEDGFAEIISMDEFKKNYVVIKNI